MTMRPLHYAAQQPMAHQSLAPQDEWEKQRKARQAEMLEAAEMGDEAARRWLMERGLRRWEKRGRRII